MSDTYTILLKNCAFFARHGALPEEAVLGQRFFVDAEMDVEAGTALEDDAVEKTVDYGEAFKIIEEVVTTSRRHLIEVLAKDIARALVERYPMIRRARITLRKPGVPIPGILDYAQVTVEHGG